MNQQTPARPLIKWIGSKWRLSRLVLENIPPHLVYIEPFGGSAAVLFRKPRAPIELYNDANQELCNVFEVVQDRKTSAELCRMLKYTPYSRAAVINAAKYQGDDKIKRAYCFLVLSHFSFNIAHAVFDKKPSFNMGIFGKGEPQTWANFRRHIPIIRQRLEGVTIENTNGLDIVEKYAQNKDALFFIDPPYYEATKERGVSYGVEFTKDDHKKLLDIVSQARARVMITTYDNEMYKKALQGWNVANYKNNSRHSSAKNKNRLELLYMNF